MLLQPIRPQSILFFMLMVFLSLWGCASFNDIKVVDTNFQNQSIAEKQNLVFHFNKALVSDSAVSDRWDTTHYIEFEPKVAGSFKWKSKDELVFSPQKGFQPDVEYKAVLTPKLLDGKDENKKIADDAMLHFRTAPLQITQSGTQWLKSRDNGMVMLRMNLNFNYNVDVAATASKLKLSVNGQPVSFNVTNGGNGKTISLQFAPVGESGRDADIQVQLNNGIPIAGSKQVSSRDTTFKVAVPSREKLEITGVQAQHDGLQGVMDVALSQPISPQNIKNLVSIKPSVNFKVAITDKGFSIVSEEFKADETYTVIVSKALRGDYGGKLLDDYKSDVKFSQLEPTISFTNSKGMYLSSKGYKNVALNIVKVPKVKVSVVKVYENNILQLFSQGTRWGYSYNEDEDEFGHSYEYYNTENLGDTVYTKVYDVDQLPAQNATHFLHLDFSDKIKGYDGVYVITMESTEQKWVQESKILSLSDIGLIAKQENNRVLVFANSIKSATPIAGAKVSFISTTNQVVFTKETDKDGVAILDDIDKQAPGFKIGMVSAKQAEDYSFLVFDQSKIETSRFDVGGRVSNTTNLNAWIYAERNLYRPGETIHASTVIRTESWALPGEMPVKLRLLMPNGKEMAVRKMILNQQGSTESAFDIPKAGLTGIYSLQVFTGNDVLLNSYDFYVEDFVPDRIKSQLKLAKNQFALGETIATSIQADNLFGTPAANRNYEWELNLDKETFALKEYKDYNFEVTKNFNYNTVLRTGKTNANGGALENFVLPSDISESGLLKGNIRATVFDETGRPVHRFAQFQVFTQPVFIGIKRFNDYVGTRSPLNINLIAVDRAGRLQTQAAIVTIVKKEWQNVIQESGGRYRYVSQYSDKTIAVNKITINGANTIYSFTPSQSGDYEVRVSYGNSPSYVAQSFYAYGGGDTQYASFEVNNEGNVTITANKEKYAKGEDIELLFTTPFEGRMLVTVERNGVLEYHLLQTQNKSASLRVKATEAFLPNVYVAATLFRPMDASDLPLTVAHGYANISVEDRANKLPVQVTMNDKSRSHAKQTITVATAPNAYVTIAAVDEGILQVRDYESPNPYDYFYQKVALGVRSFDVYPFLLPEYNISSSTTGGDGAASKMKSRVNPLFVNRVKNVSYWSGIKQADASGKVSYEIDVPQFSGKLRIMAVAYKNNAFGSFDNGLTVADPIVISTALPRFLSPGDKALMPVTLSNTTAKETTASVTVATEGPLGVTGSQTQNVLIPANSEGRAVFSIDAANKIGAGKVTVKVNAFSETFNDETDIAVRPPASLQKEYRSGIIEPGKSLTVNLQNNFLPGTLGGTVLVSNSPLVEFSKNLSYLIQYPYGCVEQTVSSAFPQLYFGDLVKALNNTTSSSEPNYNVQQAILKLQSMQLPNGALTYWPGGDTESWWGSVYAAHFLQEAIKAGFDVNDNFNNRLLNYLKAKLKKRETTTYYYNGTEKRVIIAKEVPYSLYVLALAKQPQSSLMNYYKANSSALSLDGKYLLASAYIISGSTGQGKQVLPKSFQGEKALTEFGGSFYSYVRDMGISLNALLDADPSNAQIPELTQLLTDQMKQQYSLNTQENVFALLAMGKIAKKSLASNGVASIFINQQKVTDVTTIPWSINLVDLGGKPLKIAVNGSPFYYFKEMSGIAADGIVKEEDRHLRVRRTFLDRNGNPVSGNTFRQNDLIVVKLTLQGEVGVNVENVVLTDMLPAGFEIENTRLLDLPNLKWITSDNSNTPDYLDMRDDRLNLFTSANSKEKTFYYMARAVSPGMYRLGPVQADAMYNGAYYSYNGAGSVTIRE